MVLCILSIWPRQYAAQAELLPQDSGGGLSQVLQQAGGALLSLGALTGNKQSIETDLTIARSDAVVETAVAKLQAQFPSRFRRRMAAVIELNKRVDVAAVRGSILQLTVKDHDPRVAKAIIAAYSSAIQDRLTQINLSEAAQKRAVSEDRLKAAARRLSSAQAARNSFQIQHNLPAPEIQLGASIALVANLEGQLQAKEIQLRSLGDVVTSQNIEFQMIKSQIESLQAKISSVENTPSAPGSFNLGGLSAVDTTYLNLYRDERLADTLYQVYSRYAEELEVENLSANENMELIQPAFVLPERQFNTWAVVMLALVALLAILAEVYIIWPPVGRSSSGR